MGARSHFRIFGIPVRVEPFFVIVAALFGLNLEPVWLVFAWVVIVFVSVLVHELGHALTYRAFGQRSAIVLHGFGGFTVPAGGGRRVLSTNRSIAVSVSGALAQILLLAVPARLLLLSDWGAEQEIRWFFDQGFNWWPVLYWLWFASFWWAIINLLPIRPLDGGHVAEEVLGLETACKVSIAAAAVAGFVAFRALGTLFPLLFFGILAFINFQELRAGAHTGAFDPAAPDPGGGAGGPKRPGGRGLRRPRRQGSHLQVVGGAPQLPDLRPAPDRGDAEARAWNALRNGDGSRAASVLRQLGSVQVNPFLQASVALAAGAHDLADDLFEAAYTAEPSGPPNLVPAGLLADAGRAVPLAERLVRAGAPGVEAATGLQTHLHYAERFLAAAQVGEQVFAARPPSPAQTAFEVACSWARAGKPDEALRWVEAAVDAGFRAPGVLDGEPDLAAVRSLPGWPAVRSRLSA
ncbi:MAG TPA: M50 family metallopeptidase [Acidimicrobiales bacterium]